MWILPHDDMLILHSLGPFFMLPLPLAIILRRIWFLDFLEAYTCPSQPSVDVSKLSLSNLYIVQEEWLLTGILRLTTDRYRRRIAVQAESIDWGEGAAATVDRSM